MIFPGPNEACFYLDPARGLTDSGLWYESSRFGLHITPVGYAGPAWGLSIGPSGAPRITFNGANQYGEMSAAIAARFYSVQPTTAMTVAVVARYNAPAVSDRIFSARTNAPLTGIELATGDASVNRLQLLGFDGAGAWSGATDTADAQLNGRIVVTILGTTAGVVATQINRLWHNGSGVAVSATGGSVVATWAAAVTPPRVGCSSTGVGNLFDGDLYFLGIWGGIVFTDQEAKAFSNYWLDRL